MGTSTAPSTSLSSRTASAASYNSTGAQRKREINCQTPLPSFKYSIDVNFCRSSTNKLHPSLPNSFQPPARSMDEKQESVLSAHGVCPQSKSKPRANKDWTGRSELIQRYLAAPTSDQIKNCQVSVSLPRFGCNILIRKLAIIFFN